MGPTVVAGDALDQLTEIGPMSLVRIAAFPSAGSSVCRRLYSTVRFPPASNGFRGGMSGWSCYLESKNVQLREAWRELSHALFDSPTTWASAADELRMGEWPDSRWEKLGSSEREGRATSVGLILRPLLREHPLEFGWQGGIANVADHLSVEAIQSCRTAASQIS